MRCADRKWEAAESEVVDGVAESWAARPENLWVVLARSPHRHLARRGIRFAEVAEILADVRRGILWAAEQVHRTLRPILVNCHLVGHQSYPGVGGTEQWGSFAGRVETVVVVVLPESQFAWDTETLVGPTGTWWRADTRSRRVRASNSVLEVRRRITRNGTSVNSPRRCAPR